MIYFIVGMISTQLLAAAFYSHMDNKYKDFNLMSKNAGFGSRQTSVYGHNQSVHVVSHFENPHIQSIADRQTPREGVDVEGGVVTPFNIYKPQNPVKTRIVVDNSRNVIDRRTALELKAIQDRRAGVMSGNVRESYQQK